MALLARIFGPLLARELIRLARGPVLRLAMIAAPAFVLLSLVLEERNAGREISVKSRAASASAVADNAFLLSGMVIAFALPLWICPTIVRERRSGGIDLLLTTQVSGPEILYGIAGAAVAVSIGIVSSLAPVLAMMSLFGGVSGGGILQSVATLMLEVLCLTAVSLYASVYAPTPWRTVFYSMAIGLPLFGVSWAILSSVFSIFGPNSGYEGYGAAMVLCTCIAGAMIVGVNKWLGPPNVTAFNGELQVSTRRRPRTEIEWPLANQPRSAMWAPLELHLDDSEPTKRQFRTVWLLYVLVGMPFCWLIRTGEGGGISTLLILLWVLIQPFLVVIAATNPLLGRRPGFFDDLLTTNIPDAEILNGVFRIVQPALFRLLAAPVGLSVLWFALDPLGISVSVLQGIGWVLEVVVVGAIISLADHRLGTRLIGIVAFLIVAGVGPMLAASFFAPTLHTLLYVCPLLLATAYFLQLKPTGWRTLAFCLSIHGALVIFGGWAGSRLMTRPPENALDLLNPLHNLGNCRWDLIGGSRTMLPLAVIPFALALYVCAFVLWHWARLRFDALVGRSRPPQRFAPKVAV